MRLSSFASVASLLLIPFASAVPTSNSAIELSTLQKRALDATLAELDIREEVLKKRGQVATCTRGTLELRLEYGSIPLNGRKAYSDAVLCLQSRPANTPSDVAPGAKSRYDDFVVTHIQQTPFIHYTGTFLAWHRYYVWVYEQALRTECGYTGSIPYWSWPQYVNAPQDSPIFNGDEFSMGGNGEFIPGRPDTILNPPPGAPGDPIMVPPGLGGGCVKTGPFKDMEVNLGPIALPGEAGTGPNGGLGYNPRCLKRDVGPAVAQAFTNASAVLHVMQQPDIASFQLDLQGVPGTGNLAPHGGGHYTINGDPGGDIFTSPGDPAFFLHHGQIDRVWTEWQALDPDSRQNAISGTGTLLNNPPSPDTTLDTVINLGYACGTNVTMRDIMSTTGGPFCYVYL